MEHRLIMESWRKFVENSQKHPRLDSDRLDAEQIRACKNKGVSVMTKDNGKASDCAIRGYKTPECGPQVGSFDNERWCPPGYRCNISSTCVPCHGGVYDSGKNSKYSNCKGDKKLKTHVFYKDPDGVFSIIYSDEEKKIKVLSKEKIRVGHPKYFEARDALKRARKQSLDNATGRLGLYAGYK